MYFQTEPGNAISVLVVDSNQPLLPTVWQDGRIRTDALRVITKFGVKKRTISNRTNNKFSKLILDFRIYINLKLFQMDNGRIV